MKARSLPPVVFVAALLLPVPARADAQPAQLAPLTAAQRQIFYGSAEDKLDKKICIGTRKRVMLHCRDARHYVRMNEWYHHVWHPYLQGIRGGYVGVASDQSFTFIAWARSELAWLMDYDPVVVRVNLIHVALIKASPTIADYLKRWERKSYKSTIKALEQAYKSRRDWRLIQRIFARYRGEIRGSFRLVMRQRRRQRSHWLHDAGDYAYVRKLCQLDRVRVVKGDLLKTKTLIGIGDAARKLKLPVRAIYLSNAEEFWPYPNAFKQNFIKLHMDAKTVVMRTRHTSKYGPRIGSYVYIVQGGLDFQTRLKDPRTKGVWVMMRHRRAGRPGFFTIGIPVRKATKLLRKPAPKPSRRPKPAP